MHRGDIGEIPAAHWENYQYACPELGVGASAAAVSRHGPARRALLLVMDQGARPVGPPVPAAERGATGVALVLSDEGTLGGATAALVMR